MGLDTSIDTRLNAVTALTDLVGTRIYRKQRPRGSALPCVVYYRITSSVVNHAAGVTATRHARVQVDSQADLESEARTLADAVATALSGWSDPGGTPSISMCHQMSDADLSEEPDHGTDVPRYRISQDYELWYS